MEKRKRISICLLKLWIACFVILSICSSIYVSYQHVIVGVDPTIFVSGYHWVILGIIWLFFLPLLCVIHHLSRIPESTKLHRVVSIMLIWLVLTAVLMLFCIVFAYIAPDTFAALTSISR